MNFISNEMHRHQPDDYGFMWYNRYFMHKINRLTFILNAINYLIAFFFCFFFTLSSDADVECGLFELINSVVTKLRRIVRKNTE